MTPISSTRKRKKTTRSKRNNYLEAISFKEAADASRTGNESSARAETRTCTASTSPRDQGTDHPVWNTSKDLELLKRRERGDYRGRGGKGAIRSSTTPWPGRSGDGSEMGNYDELDCCWLWDFIFWVGKWTIVTFGFFQFCLLY